MARSISQQLTALLLLLAGFVSSARADILHLKNGGKVEGEVTPIRTGYRIRTKAGVSEFRVNQVRHWEKRRTPKEEYRHRQSSLRPDDVGAQIALALWCRRNGLADKAKWHFMIAVALDPENSDARRGAGFVRQGDRWVTREASLRSRGLVQYRGKWMPKAEAIRLRVQNEREAASRNAYEEGWRILRAAAQEGKGVSLAPRVTRLLALGDQAFGALDRGSKDNFERVREAVYLTAGRMRCQKSLGLLVRGLRVERTRSLVNVLLEQLSQRMDRSDVLTEILSMTLNHNKRAVRRRGWRAIDAVSDKHAVDLLITVVDQQVTPHNPREDEDGPTEEEGGVTIGEKTYTHADAKPKKPYHPAHEALVYLTDQMFPAEVAPWQDWWKVTRDSFQFKSEWSRLAKQSPGDGPDRSAMPHRSDP